MFLTTTTSVFTASANISVFRIIVLSDMSGSSLEPTNMAHGTDRRPEGRECLQKDLLPTAGLLLLTVDSLILHFDCGSFLFCFWLLRLVDRRFVLGLDLDPGAVQSGFPQRDGRRAGAHGE
jgi:hypothetical protein